MADNNTAFIESNLELKIIIMIIISGNIYFSESKFCNILYMWCIYHVSKQFKSSKVPTVVGNIVILC